jgi:hypothetical protein
MPRGVPTSSPGCDPQDGEGGEDVVLGALGTDDLLQKLELARAHASGEHSGPPGHPQTDAECGLRRSVAGDVPDHRVHGAVLALDDVEEVAAEQGVVPARAVARGHLATGAPQQGCGQQSTLKARVLPGHQSARLEFGARSLHLLALQGVPDRAAERLGVQAVLGEEVLRSFGHRGEPGLVLGDSGEHHDGRVGRGVTHQPDRAESMGVGQMQVQQDAHGIRRGIEEHTCLGEGLAPGDLHRQSAVGQHLPHQQRVSGVVLDQQQYRGGVQGPAGIRTPLPGHRASFTCPRQAIRHARPPRVTHADHDRL